MKRLLGGQFGVVAGLLVTLVVVTLLSVGVSYLAVGSASDLRSATTKAERLRASARELQDSVRIGSVFVKGWFASPATRKPITDCAQALEQGVRSRSVPLPDPLVSQTKCQAALEQLQSERATVVAPAFTDASLTDSQRSMAALYDPPIAEVRQLVDLIARWQGLTLQQRVDAVDSLQEATRRSLAQSDAVAARQRQVWAALPRSQADDTELNRQIGEGFAEVRTKIVGSVVMVAIAVVLAAGSIAFALWRWARTRASGGERGSESRR